MNRRSSDLAVVIVAGLGLSAATLGACALTGRSINAAVPLRSELYAGFTKSVVTPTYLVVINVLPPEEMYTPHDVEAQHPIAGELVLRGPAAAIVDGSRHVEAHIYSRATGQPLTDVTPSIRVVDRTTGKVTRVDPTLMQDVIVGAIDAHFGNNVVVESHHEFTVRVDIGDEQASVSGRLD